MDRRERIIIVGGNAAGMAAARRARRRHSDLDIKVIEQSSFISTATCSIPAFLAGHIENIESLQLLSPANAASKSNIDVLIKHQAREIQPHQHLLIVENLATGQSFSLPYHRLILSTGALPVRPQWARSQINGIFTLRNLDDALALQQFVDRQQPRDFIIIGSGTIAQSCAAALRSHGMNVTIIGAQERLMSGLEEPITKRILEALREGGVEVYFSDNVYGIKASLEGKVEAVETSTRTFSCQGVLLAMGVHPNIDLAKTAGIESGVNGSIRVDRHLMTSRQGIYACGDCAHTFHRITHKPVYWPLATTASRQGRQAGENASGGQGEDPGSLTTQIWTCFQLQIARVGLSVKQAQEAGFKCRTTALRASSKAHIWGGDYLDAVIIWNVEDSRIIGAQLAGYEGVHARLNTLVTAIAGRLTVRDLERLDLGYTPQISSLWDPVQIAGRIAALEKE